MTNDWQVTLQCIYSNILMDGCPQHTHTNHYTYINTYITPPCVCMHVSCFMYILNYSFPSFHNALCHLFSSYYKRIMITSEIFPPTANLMYVFLGNCYLKKFLRISFFVFRINKGYSFHRKENVEVQRILEKKRKLLKNFY